ncbi:MAG: OmpA family protein [Myxococcales bacterium]|nr:OmpA family protein [Myxococcota bacterium]MDW8281670.1 OmpA family protein [Myxococcales bacterium]
MRLRATAGSLVVVALLLGSQAARAQVQENGFVSSTYDLQLWRPAVDSKGYVTINASQVLGHLDFSLGLVGTWAYRPLLLRLEANERGPDGVASAARIFEVRNLITPQLMFALGLFKHLEVAIGLPLSIMTGGRQVCTRTGEEETCTGFDGGANNKDDLTFSKVFVGDLALHIKGRILNTSRYPVGLGVLASVYLPLSKWADQDGHRHFLGEDNVTLRPQIIVDREWFRSRRLRTALNVGALVRFGSTTFTDLGKPQVVDATSGRFFCYPANDLMTNPPCGTGLSRSLGTQLTYGLAASIAVVRQRFDLLGEFYGYADVTGNQNAFPLEGLGALKVYLARNSFFMAGAGGGVYGFSDSGRQTGGPLWRAFLGFIFEPNIGDRDGDGIKDDVDKCPDDPEDHDDFEDEDGCPEPDNDRDGIPDVDDRCPNEPETKNGFEDEDGCPDTVDLDRDGDGIPDRLDKCPDDPEDRDGFEDEDGCPEPDNDRDGILDVDDLCPNDPEDRDHFEDHDGCPDPDNDKDRILDVDDRCPNEPETYNGFEDEDGCPDKGRVIVRRGKLEILDKIYFETDKAIIKPISYPILDAIAATLKGNPQILLIEVQGHADERGEDDYNMRLTEDRAQAVRTYLIDKGVEAGRLQARGYGETRPVCTQHNEACWSRNRRVEFVILRRADDER